MRKHEIGRVENGQLIVPSEREYRSITISNPTNNQLKILRGYIDLDEEQIASVEIPEYDETMNVITEEYFINEDTGKINKRYIIVEPSVIDVEIENIKNEI